MVALNRTVDPLTLRSPQRFNNGSEAGITEIILSESEPPFALALPMLAHLSHTRSERWFTWITTTRIAKDVLLAAGFNLENIRMVYAKNGEDAKWMTWEALNNGKSGTVVASIPALTQEELGSLESASRNGDCRGLVLRMRC